MQTRRVFVAGCTGHPTGEWVAQHARNVCWELERAGSRPTILLRDRDAKYGPAIDAVFAAHGAHVVRTPVCAPRANAYAERWVRTVREDGLDWLLILGEHHLERVLREYGRHDNQVGRTAPFRCRRRCPTVNHPDQWEASSGATGSGG